MGSHLDIIISKSSQEPEGKGWEAEKVLLEENQEEMAYIYGGPL